MSHSVRPTVRLLSVDEVARIVAEACSVLEHGTGVLVAHEEGQKLLEAAGARKEQDRLFLPHDLIEKSLASVPGHVEVFDRDESLALDLREDRVHFVPGSAAIHLFDSRIGRRREPKTADVIDLVRLVDALSSYAAQSTALVPHDVPEAVADRYRLYLALKYGRKPVITGTFALDGFAPMRDMLSLVRGGEKALADKPLAIFDCCPSPPLRWSHLTCQSLLDCARARIPVEVVSMPLAGATAPVSLREVVVQHCAETLSGIVLAQLACSGAPVIYGGAAAAFDMRRGTTPMGAIETMMIQMGCAQVGKSLGLPTHGYFGLSDAKTADYQAGMESGMGALLAAQVGINVVSGPGMLDYVLTQSLEKLVLDHSACTMALRFLRGIDSPASDPLALLRDLVSQGSLLGHVHTLRNWRHELSLPSPVIDRDTYPDWEAKGCLTSCQKAAQLVTSQLASHVIPPLPEDIDRSLDAIMAGELQRFGLPLPG